MNLGLELVDKGFRFVAGELAAGLPLGEAHWSPGITKIGMACCFEQLEEFSHLFAGRRWTQSLPERHVTPLNDYP